MWKELYEAMAPIWSRTIYLRVNHAYDEAVDAIADACHCNNPHCCAKEAAVKVMHLQYKMANKKSDEYE